MLDVGDQISLFFKRLVHLHSRNLFFAMLTYTYDGETYAAGELPLPEKLPLVCRSLLNDYCSGAETSIGLIFAWSELSPAHQALLNCSITSIIGNWAMDEFYSAIANNNLPRLTNLIRAGLSPLAHASRDGLRPVILAATAKTPACLQALLVGGADPNSTDNQGYTPLRHAADLGLDYNIEVLLSHKANPDICDRSGVTPLLSLAMSDLQDEHITSVRLLIAGGARLDLTLPGRETAVELALRYGNMLTAVALGFRRS